MKNNAQAKQRNDKNKNKGGAENILFFSFFLSLSGSFRALMIKQADEGTTSICA
jgi:hypothetical protein